MDILPIANYIETDMVNFKGHLSLTIFLTRCPFRCGYCYNYSNLDSDIVMDVSKFEDLCRNAKDSWCDSLVITGGEPGLYYDSGVLGYIIDIARRYFRYIKLDTNGFNLDMIIGLVGSIDYIAMDVKTSISEYENFTKYSKCDNIIRSIDFIKGISIGYEFRTTIIEEYHNYDILHDMVNLVKGADRYVLQRFVPGECLDVRFNKYRETSMAYLDSVSEIFKSNVKEIELL